MHTTHLQSLIATNAANIRVRQSVLDSYYADGRIYAKAGEKAFSVEAYQHAGRQRAKLAKLVNMQRALKVELQGNLRLARIDRKIEKLQAVGFVYNKPELTSREIESALDQLLSAFIPAKVDSRLAA